MNDKLAEFEANFSVLDKYGENITASEFITNPAIGRDNQIKELILILLTPEKSAILIGKPGIGKTAIVEGLAYRIQKNDVPPALLGYTIINIKTASLLGTMPSGESKVQKMIDELKQKDKVILFIDEVHMLIGATDSSSLDFANIFKEGLGRGSIKVIGATTTEEYERYILRDKAFTRRFQKVDVPEPTREETIQIMMGTLPKFEKATGRKMKYTDFDKSRIMAFLVDLTSEYKRVFAIGSRYPDISLTLLKQAFSYTVYDNREYMDIFDIKKSIENTKNVYPDVIKKELPKFEEQFKDLILEENGEKPIEEWRKSNGPTRYEQAINAIRKDDDENQTDTGSGNNLIAKSKIELVPEYKEANKPRMISLSAETLNNLEKKSPTKISDVLERSLQKDKVLADIDNILLGSPIKKMTATKNDSLDTPVIEDTPLVGLDILNIDVNDIKKGNRKQEFLDFNKKNEIESDNNLNDKAFDVYQLEKKLPEVSIYEDKSDKINYQESNTKFINYDFNKKEEPITPKNTGFLDLNNFSSVESNDSQNSIVSADSLTKISNLNSNSSVSRLKADSLLVNDDDNDNYFDDFYETDE